MFMHVKLGFIAAILILSSCSNNPEPVEPVAPPSLDGGDALDGSGAGAGGLADSAGGAGSGSGYTPETIYFGFDDYSLSSKAQERLNKLAEYLQANKNAVVQVEGHCDERGSNEYNLALGLRRAHAVQEYLTNLGLDTGRVQTISYGEEKPVVDGHGEESWVRNRRAEFVVTSQ